MTCSPSRNAVALCLTLLASAAALAERPRLAVMRFTAGTDAVAAKADQLTAFLSWRLRESGKFELLPDIAAQGEQGLGDWTWQHPDCDESLPQRVLVPYVMMEDGYFQIMVVAADPWSAARPATHVIDGIGGLPELVRAVSDIADRVAADPLLVSASAPGGKTPAEAGAAALEAPEALKLTDRMRAYRGERMGVPTGTFIDRFDPRTFRLVSYNVNFDKIFPEIDERCAEKFQRVVKALDPDILCIQEIKEKSADDVRALLNATCPLPDGRSWHAFKGWTNVIVSKYPLRLASDRTVPPGERELAIALVDLPDDRFKTDLYVLNNHWKCCGDTANDPQRQQMADAIINWIRDARSPGGAVDLPAHTPIVIAGDLNIVGSMQPVTTLLTGDIRDENRYGPDSRPDWDGSDLTDLQPRHNADGSDIYTWRNDNDKWPPGRLDFIVYTDSLLEPVHKFILNTTTLSPELLRKARLDKFDITLDDVGREFDHMPLVVDFRILEPGAG